MYKEIIKLLKTKYPSLPKIVEEKLTPSIGIKTKGRDKKGSISKFGGIPDVPENFKWPTYDDRPLSFIAQIALEEIKEFKAASIVPDKGVLYFFWDTNNVYSRTRLLFPYQIIYVPVVADLKAYSLNSMQNEPFLFKESHISFYEYFSLPINELDFESGEIDSDILFDFHEEVENRIYLRNEKRHHLFGAPEALQSSVKMNWAIQYLDLNPYQISASQKNEVINLISEFTLLLQIDFRDSNLDFSKYGVFDAMLYYGIHKAHLNTLHFNKSNLVYQNY